jgi:EEF1A lysine methyltransferase 4
MPTATLSFESRQYWDSRFTRSPQSFDWLVSPSVLIPHLLNTLSQDASPNSTPPSILHIGCGTSNLSNLLRLHAPPSTVTNVDFSHRAIELGIQREREEFAEAGTKDGKGSMSWATVDLLDRQSIWSVIGRNAGDSKPSINDSCGIELGNSMPSSASTCSARFSIMIEKSCADAIACGEDVTIPVPYCLDPVADRTKPAGEVVYIHPVCLLAIHLAALTKPGGMWIVLSYSETRFDCLYSLEGGDDEYHELKNEGMVPNPATLWTVVKKQEIISQVESKDGSVYRPRISHWLYMLRRTDHEIA